MQQISFRNVQKLDEDRFDCEIEHPQFGWIPFTADKNDVEPHGREIYEALLQSTK
jgi:hypothetical protein